MFNHHSCAYCYFFLFQGYPLFPNGWHSLTVIKNRTHFPLGYRLVADAENSTSREAVCSTLTEDECQRWRLCCTAARRCCAKQLSITGSGSATHRNDTCAATWDGYGCWDPGEPGMNSYLSCPTYIQFSVPTSKWLLYIRKFTLGFYFCEIFVKIKPSRNGEITLPFTDIHVGALVAFLT